IFAADVYAPRMPPGLRLSSGRWVTGSTSAPKNLQVSRAICRSTARWLALRPGPLASARAGVGTVAAAISAHAATATNARNAGRRAIWRAPRARRWMRMAPRLWGDLERRRQTADRAVTDPDVDRPGLHRELTLLVVEAEVRAAQGERDRLRLPRREGHPLEALESAHGLEDARVALVDVELYCVVTRHRAGVGDVGADGQRAGGGDAAGRQLQVRERERGVGQAIAERVLRGVEDVEVLRRVFVVGIKRAPGRELVVGDRDLTYIARERHR